MSTPPTALELVSGQLDWALANITNNLDFIPADKLDWKPAPEAKSVLEIVNHMTGTVNMLTSGIKGETNELTPATDTASAKALVTQVITSHQALLKTLTPADLGRTITLPMGDLPLPLVATMPAIELANHHGQITYIETLLGDTESHLVF